MNELTRHFKTGHPLLRLAAWDEDDAVRALVAAARESLGPNLMVHEWDAAVGLCPAGGDGSLAGVLALAAADLGPALYVLRDAHRVATDPAVVRHIRRLPAAIARRPVSVVLVTPPVDILPDLAHDVPTVLYTVPDFDGLLAIVAEEAAGALDKGMSPRIVASALRGLTGTEARLAIRRSAADGPIGVSGLTRLFSEKTRRIEGSTLEFFPPTVSFADVGGLDGVKEWVRKRAAAFRGDATAGVALPRGLLFTGVSGCGKSYAVKALSHAMSAPLFRLDMSRVFARPEPEAAFARAISAAESMAPCLLWIDEIENALALGTQDSGPASRISGSFLTWLQERPEGIFVAATANRIELLPAELLRRGRFDQVFFVDLPEEDDRKRIWGIHLSRRGINTANVDIIVLARSSAGWSGAEIEAAVESALIEAGDEGKPLQQPHLFRAIGRTVPLSVTMKEQIKRIKEWAHERAYSASGKPM